MANVQELQVKIDGMTLAEVREKLVEIGATWPVHPAQTDTLFRREQALNLYAQLNAEVGWLEPARAWLHELTNTAENVRLMAEHGWA